MPGDTYQTPSFAWRHAARDGDLVNVSEATTAATPDTWLGDNQARRLVVRSASGAMTIQIDRGALSREPLDRLIIPTGHNLSGRRFTLYESDATYAVLTAVQPYSRLRGSAQVNSSATLHGGVCVYDFPAMASRYFVLLFAARVTSVAELGEVWLTKKETPTIGFGAEYEYGYETNVLAATLRSGALATIERGTQRRTMVASAENLSGTDHDLYVRMMRDTGSHRDPVWIDPTLGGYDTLIDDMQTTPSATWTPTGGTLADSATHYAGGQSLAITKTAAPGVLQVARTFATMDLRGRILRVAIRISALGAGFTATDGIRIYLATTGAPADYSGWQFGTNYILAAGVFYTLSIDLDSDAAQEIGGDGADPARCETITVRAQNAAVSDILYVDDIHTLNKDKEPWLAHLTSTPSWTQSSSVPLAGQFFTRSFTFVESIG